MATRRVKVLKVGSLSADFLVRFNAVATGVWIVLVIPTLLLWRESILWVAFMSLWANAVSHFAAWQAARAEAAVIDSNNSDGGSAGEHDD
jgi:predicted tellurium resistance membrane protein TerC